MRIRRMTTQMVNNSRRRAGLSPRSSSLLKSVQKSKTGRGSRIDALSANSIQSARAARVGYEKLQRTSSSLADRMALLSEKADKGITEANSADVSSTAAGMVEDFNATLKYLQENSGILNDYYRQSMREITSSNKTELSEIGITVGTDGTLSFHKDKFEEADGEKIKKVLGAEGVFSKRVASVASRVADNAKVNMENTSSQYNSAGSMANSYLSRFNLRG